jgi:hypothetical protein
MRASLSASKPQTRAPDDTQSPAPALTLHLLSRRASVSAQFACELPSHASQRRMPREMISRWMSEVPSSISSSFASRIHFSTGYSRE